MKPDFAVACATPWNEAHLVAGMARAATRAAPRASRVGHGVPVLVVPGFGTGDGAMWLLHRDLEARGFSPQRWNLGINRGPRGQTLRLLARRVRSLSREYGQRVHIVGWSLGGLLARVVASRASECTGRVITLGTPLSGDPRCSWLSSVVGRVLGRPLQDRRSRRLLAEGASVPVASVYSRHDGVVHWEASIGGPGEISPIEVRASHLGMVADPDVFDAVALELERALRRERRTPRG